MLLTALKKFNIPYQLQHTCWIYVISLLALLLYLSDEQWGTKLGETLIYQRDAITQGQLWRLFTGHLLHSNFYHLVMNVAGLLLLWILHGHFYTAKNTASLFLISSLFISVALYYFSPSLHRYVGLSGVLHSLFIFGVMLEMRQKDKIAYLLFIGIWLKIANEQFFGASEELAALINAQVAINAHLWGTVVGCVFTLIYLYLVPQTGNAINSGKGARLDNDIDTAITKNDHHKKTHITTHIKTPSIKTKTQGNSDEK
jgi:rhomboid family GlyGly-CTERM serine protease